MLKELADRCNVIEECYEFMLAFAAQGLAGEEGSGKAAQLRDLMGRAVTALSGLSAAYSDVIPLDDHAERYHAFLAVLERDSRDALAAMELVLVQPNISSQLIDNLNASIHLRALLTDLFLIDEILKARTR